MYIYNTNAIEGSPVTEYDTAFIIQSTSFLENYSAKENMEVLGSSKAGNYIRTLPGKRFPAYFHCKGEPAGVFQYTGSLRGEGKSYPAFRYACRIDRAAA